MVLPEARLRLRRESMMDSTRFPTLAVRAMPSSGAGSKRARFEPAPLLGMARTARVGNRVLSIIDSRRSRKRASGRTIIGALIVTVLVVAPLSVLRPALAKAAQEKRFQKFAIPDIPHTRSQEIAPGVFLAKNGIASLGNGIDVRLVGLSSAGSEGTLWSLSKGPVADPEPWTRGFYNSVNT